MATEYYIADKNIVDKMMELVAKNHPDLALVSDEIAVVFREKAAKSGGQVVLGTARKSSPLLNALSGEEYKFILEIAQDQWSDLTGRQQEALLDHLLCSCLAEEDPQSGTLKTTVRKPDIMAFRENVERYGMWFPKSEEDDDQVVSNDGGDDGDE